MSSPRIPALRLFGAALAAAAIAASGSAPALAAKAPSLRPAKSVRVAEGATARIKVTLSTKARRTGSVRVRTVAGTAGAADFTPRASLRLVFKKGKRTARVSVKTLEDASDEPNEKFSVRFSRAKGLRITRRATSVTILDDDAPQPTGPSPAVSARDLTVAEQTNGFVQVPLTLSAPSSRATSVAYTTVNGTASAGGAGDYLASSGTVVIPAGATATAVPVYVRNDATDEDDQTFRVRLSAPSGVTIADSEAVVTIADNDPPPTISIDDVAKEEANTVATFTATLSAPSERPVTVKVSTSDGTATGGASCAPGTDYISLSNVTLTLTPGESTKTVNVGVCDDALTELAETVNVVLSQPTNATLGDGTGLLTIPGHFM